MSHANIISITETFFLCTHIPIRAVTSRGESICLSGYTEDFQDIYDKNCIFLAAKRELKRNMDKPFIIISCEDNIRFTACHICSVNAHSGFFILGPYSNEPCNKDIKFVHKPDFCIPHLVSLLYDLRNSVCSITKELSFSNLNFNPYVKKAIEYIHKNFHSSITLEDVADHVKINKCYFCSIFKKETGKSYSEFLNHVRIEKSKELLMNKNLSILDISLTVGFNNQAYFNTVFKKQVNMTPMEFRNYLEQKNLGVKL